MGAGVGEWVGVCVGWDVCRCGCVYVCVCVWGGGGFTGGV